MNFDTLISTACNFDNLHFPPQLQKYLYNILRRPIVFNYGIFSGKVPEFFDDHIKSITL